MEIKEMTGISWRICFLSRMNAVSPHELSTLPDRTLYEVAESAGSNSGIKQRWYRVDDALCRQDPAEGVLSLPFAQRCRPGIGKMPQAAH